MPKRSRPAVAVMMSRVLPIAVAWLVCTGAHAAWTPVEGSDASYEYADFASLESEGSLRRIWLLSDLVVADADGDLSYRNQMEYDCAQRRHRALQSIFHAGHMGTGRVTGKGPGPSEWRPIAAGSISATVMAKVCR